MLLRTVSRTATKDVFYLESSQLSPGPSLSLIISISRYVSDVFTINQFFDSYARIALLIHQSHLLTILTMMSTLNIITATIQLANHVKVIILMKDIVIICVVFSFM